MHSALWPSIQTFDSHPLLFHAADATAQAAAQATAQAAAQAKAQAAAQAKAQAAAQAAGEAAEGAGPSNYVARAAGRGRKAKRKLVWVCAWGY